MMANWTFEPNYYLLCLIFATCLIAKLLKAVSATSSKWIVRCIVREPRTLEQLKKDVAAMRVELQTINITDNFADHSRLRRKINKKEEEMNKLDKEYRGSHLRASTVVETLSGILIVMLRVGVVFVNRSTPVAVLSPHSLWPLSAILSFPTGVSGAIGGPCWGIMCAQTIDSVVHIVRAAIVKEKS